MSESTLQTSEAMLLTIDQVAELLGLSERSVYNFDRSGRLGPVSVKLGKCSRWVRSELEAWTIAGCPNRRQWQAMRAGKIPA